MSSQCLRRPVRSPRRGFPSEWRRMIRHPETERTRTSVLDGVRSNGGGEAPTGAGGPDTGRPRKRGGQAAEMLKSALANCAYTDVTGPRWVGWAGLAGLLELLDWSKSG